MSHNNDLIGYQIIGYGCNKISIDCLDDGRILSSTIYNSKYIVVNTIFSANRYLVNLNNRQYIVFLFNKKAYADLF